MEYNNVSIVVYQPTTYVITQAEYDMIRNRDIDTIRAIKFIRAQYKLSLKQSKDIVEQILNDHGKLDHYEQEQPEEPVRESVSLGELLRRKLDNSY